MLTLKIVGHLAYSLLEYSGTALELLNRVCCCNLRNNEIHALLREFARNACLLRNRIDKDA